MEKNKPKNGLVVHNVFRHNDSLFLYRTCKDGCHARHQGKEHTAVNGELVMVGLDLQSTNLCPLVSCDTPRHGDLVTSSRAPSCRGNGDGSSSDGCRGAATYS